ncbi:MAG: hypothetical protein GX456_12285 [Verrucomicrobia bacterium]|nr:hypothetical protein [Verrucomicrobiota bacterium]
MGMGRVGQLLLIGCFMPVYLAQGAGAKVTGEDRNVSDPIIDYVLPTNAPPNAEVRIVGRGFGVGRGWVVLSGLRVGPYKWTDSEITFTVPGDAASGSLVVRSSSGARSAPVPFVVDRALPPGQLAPYGLALERIGLPGAAFLVETDGECLYGVSGFEALCVYEIKGTGSHERRSRFYLNQRVGKLRVRSGYLFVAGDHGLLIYRCADLREGKTSPVAAIAGGSYIGVDARSDPAGRFGGLLVGLCEHAPLWGATTLRVLFYQFVDDELIPLGTFGREAAPEERQHSIALDPLNSKAYVSGYLSVTGADKYILELDTSAIGRPRLNHREETGAVLACDMDVCGSALWTGVAAAGNQLFRVYELCEGTNHLSLSRTIYSGISLGRVSCVKVIDERVTAGCSWYGERPDIFLLDTFGTKTLPSATYNSLDWAFGVTGFLSAGSTNSGKVIVADEWGGFITLDFQLAPKFSFSRQRDYQWVVSAAMTENISLAGDRVYVAGRGAGPWSASCTNVADESNWRHVEFDWSLDKPQPNPVSAVCTRRDPEAGTLIAALGHEKAMAWGEKVIGLLYRETDTNILLLAESETIDPPGGGSSGVSAVWPEPDLVYMLTGSDGFRAYVVDPSAPSITLHRDCRASGFATNIYSTSMQTRCMKYHADAGKRRLIITSWPGLLVGDPTLNIFRIEYPDGPPDRRNPNAPIQVTHEMPLLCSRWKSVQTIDVTDSGLVAMATGGGVAVFHLSWLPLLNNMTDAAAWNRIRIPAGAFSPWWDSSWSLAFADVCFVDDSTLYVVKNPEGLWRLKLNIDLTNATHSVMATAYYPGVTCGMSFALLLHGWANPDIPTLHHPYALAADRGAAYVTGWSGKIQTLTPVADAGARIDRLQKTGENVEITFFSPFGDRTYRVESAVVPTGGLWKVEPQARIQRKDGGFFTAAVPVVEPRAQFYRISISP